MLTLAVAAARFHALHGRSDTTVIICYVLLVSLHLCSCIAALAMVGKENALPASQADYKKCDCSSHVGCWGGSAASTADAKPAWDSRAAENSDFGLHSYANFDDHLLLRDLVIRAAAFDGSGQLPMERWLSDGGGPAGMAQSRSGGDSSITSLEVWSP